MRVAASLGVAAALLFSAPAAADVPPGFDLFETDPQATVFSFREEFTIPPNFFDEGSAPFQGDVHFSGVPLITFQGQDVGDADTIVRRPENATLAPPFPAQAGAQIELVALSLQSIVPIVVDVGGTQQPWEVFAEPSPSRSSQGGMSIQQTEEQGGTFDSQLQVFPKFTFTRLSDGTTRELDVGALQMGGESRLKLILSANDVPWRAGCVPPALLVPGLNDAFCPAQTIPGDRTLAVEQAAVARHGVMPAGRRLEHFQCHPGRASRFQERDVTLRNQFGEDEVRVVRRVLLCAPARKGSEPWRNRRAHLQCYNVDGAAGFASPTVQVRDQFAGWPLRVRGAQQLCLPASKSTTGRRPEPLPESSRIDHFTCHRVDVLQDARVRQAVVRDQFGRVRLRLIRPARLCAPTDKNGEGILDPVDHLLCYRTEVRSRGSFRPVSALVRDQFGRHKFRVERPGQLCVPADKVVVDNPTGPGGGPSGPGRKSSRK